MKGRFMVDISDQMQEHLSRFQRSVDVMPKTNKITLHIFLVSYATTESDSCRRGEERTIMQVHRRG